MKYVVGEERGSLPGLPCGLEWLAHADLNTALARGLERLKRDVAHPHELYILEHPQG